MRYYRCMCGEVRSLGSMPPHRCSGCKKCNTTLEEHPDYHTAPEPHDFSSVQQVDTDNGPQPLTLCKYCHRSKQEVE